MAGADQRPEQAGDPGVLELRRELGRELFHQAALRYLGMSGPEFLRRWDDGEYVGADEDAAVMSVAALIPFAR